MKANISSLNQIITLLEKNSDFPQTGNSMKMYRPMIRVKASVIPISDKVNAENKIKVRMKFLPHKPDLRFCGIIWKKGVYDIKTPCVYNGEKFIEFIAQENT